MDGLVKELVGLVVWLVANGVYLASVRKGEKGFRRLLAFWMGIPGTLVTLMAVREGSQPVLEPPPDDEDALLAEVRRARRLRAPDDGNENPEVSP